jgi:hypothetical protein
MMNGIAEKEKKQETDQFLCPPCLYSGSIFFFISCPFFVRADEVKKKANIIAANLEMNTKKDYYKFVCLLIMIIKELINYLNPTKI